MTVGLIDGSLLKASRYLVEGPTATLTLLDGRILDIPLKKITHAQLQSATGGISLEWERLLRREARGDMLVIRKDDAIDYLEGVLHDATDDRIHFELDGDVLPVKRSKVFGVIYPRATIGLSKTTCQIVGNGGSVWNVASLSLDKQLRWLTPAGVEVSYELATARLIDFSRGKVLFLSDQEPESSNYVPYFGGLTDRPAIQQFRAPRTDTNLEGAPLRLDGKEYSKGLSLHSRTELVYRLPDRYRRFQATLGIDDAARPRGDIRLVIRGDARVLFEQVVRGTNPAEAIDLDISGVRRLTILADFGEGLDIGDHLDLCEARVIK